MHSVDRYYILHVVLGANSEVGAITWSKSRTSWIFTRYGIGRSVSTLVMSNLDAARNDYRMSRETMLAKRNGAERSGVEREIATINCAKMIRLSTHPPLSALRSPLSSIKMVKAACFNEIRLARPAHPRYSEFLKSSILGFNGQAGWTKTMDKDKPDGPIAPQHRAGLEREA